MTQIFHVNTIATKGVGGMMQTFSALTEKGGKMMAELKPCPFCGGEAEERFMKRKKLFSKFRFPYNTHYVYIRCKVCGAGTAVKCSSENAVEAWNRRVDNG